VAIMGNIKSVYTILMGLFLGKVHLGDPKIRWKLCISLNQILPVLLYSSYTGADGHKFNNFTVNLR
jgi:hypothetical protein